jgi:hypothetical protein
MQESKNKKNNIEETSNGFKARLVLKRELHTTATSRSDSFALVFESGTPYQAPEKSNKSFWSKALALLKEILVPVITGILVELAKQLLLKG